MTAMYFQMVQRKIKDLYIYTQRQSSYDKTLTTVQTRSACACVCVRVSLISQLFYSVHNVKIGRVCFKPQKIP